MRLKNRRKHFLVDKALQLHYLIYIVLTLGIASAVGLTGNYYGIWASVIKAFSEESLQETLVTSAQINEYQESRRPTDMFLKTPSLRTYRETSLLSERQKEIVRQIMNETTQKTIALSIVLLFFIGWGSIFLTHQIAGPLYKLSMFLDRIKEGDLTSRIHFRKFDEVRYLAGKFNAMVESLDSSVSELKQILRESNTEIMKTRLNQKLSKYKTSK